jgi:hypothetical protein
VHEIWSASGLKPHLVKTFKVSTDPAFEEKLERNGTTTLFAAIDVLTGMVIGQCLPRHRHEVAVSHDPAVAERFGYEDLLLTGP